MEFAKVAEIVPAADRAGSTANAIDEMRVDVDEKNVVIVVVVVAAAAVVVVVVGDDVVTKFVAEPERNLWRVVMESQAK